LRNIHKMTRALTLTLSRRERVRVREN